MLLNNIKSIPGDYVQRESPFPAPKTSSAGKGAVLIKLFDYQNGDIRGVCDFSAHTSHEEMGRSFPP